MINALLLSCLVISLTGCGTSVVVKREVIPELPPVILIQDCEQPLFNGSTYGDVVLYVPELQSAIAQCNADKQALREWRDQRLTTASPVE
jgi:hypothetical protein